MPEIDFRALTPLILFALWAVLLAFRLGLARFGAMQRDKRAVNTFKPVGDTEPLDAFSRAHMNTLENLPIFAVVYMSALWVDAGAPILTLGWVILAARIVQSLVHTSSRSNPAVQLRALMQLVQLVCFLWLGIAAVYWANAD
jgi:uncharacterized membrane protein YecN with MAPEG domain